MASVFQHLYYGTLNESERPVEKLRERKEFKEYWEALQKLEASFSNEQKKLFLEFDSHNLICAELEKARAYANGVKLGMKMILELNDFQPCCAEESP